MVPPGFSRRDRPHSARRRTRKVLGDHSANRKLNLVNRLLGRRICRGICPALEQYLDDDSDRPFGRHEGRRQDSGDREGMAQYLRDSFETNKPYHQMVKELVSATGDIKPGEDRFQRGREFPERQDGRQRHSGHRQDGPDFPRPVGAMHAVPQPSVQRLEAESVLGNERLLPPDARSSRRWRRRRRSKMPSWSTSISAAKAAIPDSAELYYELRNGIMRGRLSGVRRRPGDQPQRLSSRKSIAATSWPR